MSGERALEDGVVVSDQELRFVKPGKPTVTLRWDDIREVRVRTTADGPFAEDVFFLIEDGAGRLTLPQSTVPTHLLDRLQHLPGFDNAALIKAMSSVEEAEFLCYQRTTDT